ncbi:hypothetical protein [Pontixanthobacter sp.]|uniref:hypothetical protein n=1 Tax=Pontixanthobacter sp. TaxID=2792078 RepID=UPI003C7B6D1B
MLSAAVFFLLQVGPNPTTPQLEPLPIELKTARAKQAETQDTDALPTDPLTRCLMQAELTPLAAQSDANQWLETAIGLPRAHALHCRGFAETRLGNWTAAAQSFTAARAEGAIADRTYRARLGAIAANALIAGGDVQAGLDMLDTAIPDAAASGFTALEAEMRLDYARAQVMLGRIDAAGESLALARQLAPSSSQAWLLSATLSRRTGDLGAAATHIAQAKQLNQTNPEIALEAGVIAVLSGDEAGARANWQSVIILMPGTPVAATAQDYLAQLGVEEPAQ